MVDVALARHVPCKKGAFEGQQRRSRELPEVLALGNTQNFLDSWRLGPSGKVARQAGHWAHGPKGECGTLQRQHGEH